MRHLSNQEIASMLSEMAALYEIEGVPFKPRAYERAAYTISSLDEPLASLYKKGGESALMHIGGVGKGIASHLIALFEGKPFREYDRLRKRTPVAVGELMAIEGVGPRTVKTLYEKLHVRNLKDLERAAKEGKIAKLPHFGPKSAAKILKGIAFLTESGGRRLLGSVLPAARAFEKRLRAFPEVTEAVAAGSLRRRKETIGDIDMLVVSRKPEKTMEQFLKFSEIVHVYGTGPTKTNVRLNTGMDMDVRVVPKESFGAALNYFTGSKDHNIALRELALKRGWKLSEYGLFQKKGRKEVMIAGASEEELYKKLGLSYIEPELREMTGEIDAARAAADLRGTNADQRGKGLPKLIGYNDLRGDLQMHTNWTDGQNSIGEMAEAAAGFGLEYIAITDHTKGLAMTGGLDGKQLAQQRKEIDAVNLRLSAKGGSASGGKTLTVLQGAEVNIKKDGSLDLPHQVLAQLNVVGAAVHSHFDLPRAEQTKRLIAAINHPLVQMLYHPSGRLLNRRRGIDADWDEVFAAAKEERVALEIDASPERLDLQDAHIRTCVERGVRLVIDSDAHSPAGFRFLELGIAQARRGWAAKKDVLNTLPLQEFLKKLKARKK